MYHAVSRILRSGLHQPARQITSAMRDQAGRKELQGEGRTPRNTKPPSSFPANHPLLSMQPPAAARLPHERRHSGPTEAPSPPLTHLGRMSWSSSGLIITSSVPAEAAMARRTGLTCRCDTAVDHRRQPWSRQTVPTSSQVAEAVLQPSHTATKPQSMSTRKAVEVCIAQHNTHL